ncbi:MAG: hypothetical protein P857_18 [Candidatus Xenolissoclinum pacificiensis L6]|uniref:Uncharacterized protein n=1 Tax=Candidatus Xenolissoclinum pacificiensis L6 TaxID=1401685 RepID=W2UZI3_9RICK|nr:MAG: hypothetical protein P857_18 [Candidatus Xenolissoclinum pacificiensis L6]
MPKEKKVLSDTVGIKRDNEIIAYKKQNPYDRLPPKSKKMLIYCQKIKWNKIIRKSGALRLEGAYL